MGGRILADRDGRNFRRNISPHARKNWISVAIPDQPDPALNGASPYLCTYIRRAKLYPVVMYMIPISACPSWARAGERTVHEIFICCPFISKTFDPRVIFARKPTPGGINIPIVSLPPKPVDRSSVLVDPPSLAIDPGT